MAVECTQCSFCFIVKCIFKSLHCQYIKKELIFMLIHHLFINPFTWILECFVDAFGFVCLKRVKMVLNELYMQVCQLLIIELIPRWTKSYYFTISSRKREREGCNSRNNKFFILKESSKKTCHNLLWGFKSHVGTVTALFSIKSPFYLFKQLKQSLSGQMVGSILCVRHINKYKNGDKLCMKAKMWEENQK